MSEIRRWIEKDAENNPEFAREWANMTTDQQLEVVCAMARFQHETYMRGWREGRDMYIQDRRTA